ncbi:MAG: undecaprenyl-phosphate galactose phosphotransferase WbaP [Treponema sp.]|nr:undecaprenyl-phosphate galactose phosphotransferase WbaP [Treponema sp.]
MSVSEYASYFKSHYKRTSSFVSGTALMIVDAAMIMLSIGAGFFVINLVNNDWINFRSFITYSIYLPVILIVFYAASLYPGILLAPQEEVKRFSLCSFFSFLGIAVSINVEGSDQRFPIALALVVSWPFATLLLPVGREVAKHIFAHFDWWGVPAVLFSKGTSAKVIADRLIRRPYYGYSPALIISDMENPPEDYLGVPIFERSDELDSLIKKLNIKVAILCDYNHQIEKLQTNYRYIVRVPKRQNSINMSLHMRDFGGILGFSSTNYLTKKSPLFLKRLIDVAICLAVAPVLLPIVLIIALAIKLDSPGPVFYGHTRVGRNRKPIKCWKFRSMGTDSQEQLKHILATDPVRAAEWEKDRKFTDDPRVTKVGRILRKTSLDELPQLWNIFTGEMSFVGPRPVTEPELVKYGDYADYVLTVKPGLSGMWQISGRSDTGYEERITLDTYYIQNWSIWLDIWIIIKTVWVVFRGKGAY